jgi:hypothetical protein
MSGFARALTPSVEDPLRDNTKPVITLTTHEATTRKTLIFIELRNLRTFSVEYDGQSLRSASAFDYESLAVRTSNTRYVEFELRKTNRRDHATRTAASKLDHRERELNQ